MKPQDELRPDTWGRSRFFESHDYYDVARIEADGSLGIPESIKRAGFRGRDRGGN
jgi:hypothetical protein